jgi:hypothetical protein
VNVLHGSRRIVQRALELARRGRARRSTTLLVDAPIEDALIVSAAALRRLGARITRYDVDEGALEARKVSDDRDSILSIRVAPESERTTRLALASDAPDAAKVFSRFRRALNPRRATALPGRVRAPGESEGGVAPVEQSNVGGPFRGPHQDR